MICSMPLSYVKDRRSITAGKRRPPRRLLIVVRARPGVPTQGLVNVAGTVFRCALGRGGITAAKREGDGGTPLARMALLGGYVRGRAFSRATRLPLSTIGPTLGWCEVPGDRNYNRPVRLPYAVSHERMLRDDGLYDACIVLDWNIRPRRRGRGSAIFFHLARPGYTPTQGCVAVSRRTMARLLPMLSRRAELWVMR
ncbi:MAG TPA: hypothetical protein GX405_05175 [Rhizobiales bacterium]|nr:hypothetical protein [Hyphomicrobiales bacterium]